MELIRFPHSFHKLGSDYSVLKVNKLSVNCKSNVNYKGTFPKTSKKQIDSKSRIKNLFQPNQLF